VTSGGRCRPHVRVTHARNTQVGGIGFNWCSCLIYTMNESWFTLMYFETGSLPQSAQRTRWMAGVGVNSIVTQYGG